MFIAIDAVETAKCLSFLKQTSLRKGNDIALVTVSCNCYITKNMFSYKKIFQCHK